MTSLLPVLVLLSSAVTGVITFFLREEQVRARTALNVIGATAKVVFVGVMLVGNVRGEHYEARWSYLPGIDLVLRVDDVSLLFVGLSSVLWLITTVYAIGYLEESPDRSRFFGFFSLCVTATMGIALAGNPVTFLVFYELLTVTTYPLVVHRGTAQALAAGRTYAAYTLAGGVVLLVAVAWLHALFGPLEFTSGGAVRDLAAGHTTELRVIFALFVVGLGVKTALVPLHGWLPIAMVAPAPVSALLHAVAVVKAGAYGIVRVVNDLYGLDVADELGVLGPLAAAAAVTIVYGSLRALRQDELKRRLAFSTVSQVSYIVLGIAVFGPLSTVGALAHLVHQGIMKVTLFFCAGNIAEILGVHRIRDLAGVGRRMPLTMAAFTIAAFGMMGLPPTAGFATKWYLGLGALEAGQWWVLAVLLVSTLLNAAYFLPILVIAWFRPAEGPWSDATTGHSHPGHRPTRGGEAPLALLGPAVATAVLTVAFGLLAGVGISPVGLAVEITTEIYEAL